MNIDDLNWQVTNYGGISPRIVDLLLERRRLDLVIQAAERGEWFCVEGAVRELCSVGQFERAWALLEPFSEIGWEVVKQIHAEILFAWGRVEEALSLIRRGEAPDERNASPRAYVKMLVRAGRASEAIQVIAEAGIGELSFLFEIMEGQGCDENLLDLITPLAEESRRTWGDDVNSAASSNLQELQALILDRLNRRTEAIQLLSEDVALHRYDCSSLVALYAKLLHRNGRIDTLLKLGRSGHRDIVFPYCAYVLEENGRVCEAEKLLRESIEATGDATHRAALVGLLSRQGKMEEVIEVGQVTFEFHDHGNLLETIVNLLEEGNLHGRALEIFDSLSKEYIEANRDSVWPRRLQVMANSGRLDEAIYEATHSRSSENYYRDIVLAQLLEQGGRADEAMEILRRATKLGRIGAHRELAEMLIRQGRLDDAIEGFPSVGTLRREAMLRSMSIAPAYGSYGENPPY